MKYSQIFLIIAIMLLPAIQLTGQEVPYGINYQAVARDNYGDELTNKQIDIRFSILSGTPLGNLEYQEVHTGIVTSKYGVFSVIAGQGTPVAGDRESFADIAWGTDCHFLKVEIRFGSDFSDMGTMQFLSVPYALYAAKSLEPGPVGPDGVQGPPGDPATDDQTLSFDGINLSIDGGNIVNLASLLNVDDADADPDNEIQDLRLENDSLRITLNTEALKIGLSDYKQKLNFNSVENKLSISDGNEVDLSSLVNTDNQQLIYNELTHELTITNGTSTVDLDDLKNDADADPTNELVTSLTIEGAELILQEGANEKGVNLSGNIIAFRTKKGVSVAAPIASDVTFIPDNIIYNEGEAFNSSTGEFTAPFEGIYIFNATFTADGSGGSRKLSIYLSSSLYEDLEIEISPSAVITNRSITMRLLQDDIIKLVINTGLSTQTGTGSISGFRVY